MPRYVIHIGLPKTGTKYLQTNFRRFAGDLADEGILYPAEWWASDREVNHDAILAGLANPDASWLDESFARFQASDHKKILLSCEGLVSINATQHKRLKQLTAGASVKIVFFCRRWSDWIPSAWQQSVKQGNVETYPEFLAKTLSDFYRVASINFEPSLASFAESFGDQSLTVISYSHAGDTATDIAQLFFNNILELKRTLPVRTEAVHQSIGIAVAEVARCLNIAENGAGGVADVAVYRRLERFRNRSEVKSKIDSLTETMTKFVADMIVDDESQAFRPLLSHLTARYQNAVLPISGRKTLFEPRRNRTSFIRQDYLLQPKIAEQVDEIRRLLLELDRPTAPVGVGYRQSETQGVALSVLSRDASTRLLELELSSEDADSQTALDVGFGTSATKIAMFGEGWSVPETHFRWTVGCYTKLSLSQPALPGAYRLLFVIKPFLVPEKLAAQRLSVDINGHAMGPVSIFEDCLIACHCPWQVLISRPRIDIEFSLPDAARPSDLTGSNDQRQIALCFHRALLVRSGDIAAAN